MDAGPHRSTAPPPAFSGLFSRGFLFALVIALSLWTLGREAFRGSLLVPDAESRVIAPRGELAADERSTIELFEAAAPSVVHIQTTRTEPRRGFFSSRAVEVPEGSGTGFVWDTEGHVVTNYHVVQNAESAYVILQDGGKAYPARFVGGAPDSDLAVLRIEAPESKLVPIALGESKNLRVGQRVFAIGNPFGLDKTLTTGVISGLERMITSVTNMTIHGVIQTDAAINPGNSGGPLLDSAGRLIGVNTAIKSPTGSYAGIGFAVPVDLVNQKVPRILRTGFAERAGLGIYIGPDEWGTEQGLLGAVIDQVVPGGAADRAGLRGSRHFGDGSIELGDVIVAIDDVEIDGKEDLFAALHRYEAGQSVGVTVHRFAEDGSDARHRLDVTLQALRSR